MIKIKTYLQKCYTNHKKVIKKYLNVDKNVAYMFKVFPTFLATETFVFRVLFVLCVDNAVVLDLFKILSRAFNFGTTFK